MDPICTVCNKPSRRGLSSFPDVGLVCPDCGRARYPTLAPAQKLQHPEFDPAQPKD